MGWIEPTSKALVPPVQLATTFERDPDNEYRSGRSYVRNRPSSPPPPGSVGSVSATTSGP